MKQLEHRPRPRRRDPGPENNTAANSPHRWTAAASIAAVAASLLASTVFAAPAHAADPPVITLTFDDGNADQVAAAQILNQAGLKGTFYLPSGYLNASGYMTTAQAQALQTAGNEIGGHTVTHPDLALAGTDEVKRQVCNDRVNLTNMGFRVTSFAYPFASISAAAKQSVQDCGYNSARGLGDLESHVVGTAGFGFAEAMPPADPFETRAPDQVDNSWTLQNLKDVVTKAQPAGGWVQLTFHHIGDGKDPGTNTVDPNTVTTAMYSEFVTWLKDQQTAGLITVKTVDQVIGGTVKPAVSGPAAPPASTTGNLIHNPGLETAGPVVGGLPQCWAAGGFGTNTRTFGTAPGRTGTTAGRLELTAWTDGDGKILPALDLGECAPSAIPGHQYQIKAWYQSTGNTQFELYYRTGLGTWNYWQGAGSPWFGPANVWTQATYLTPPLPQGATAISVGMNLFQGPGVLMTDDFELTDAVAAIPAAATTAIAAAALAPPSIGQPLGIIVCGLTADGCYQNYQRGVIHWSPTTGARITKGAIDALWASLNWERGTLGYPTSNEVGGLKNGGVYQNFQGGVVHWSPSTGAHFTKGAIYAAWAAQNWENGDLGYPTGNEVTGLKDGGVYQNFQGGVVHWSPATGARITKGAIRSTWAAFNWENGFLGYPTSNEITGLKNGGVYQNFQGGVVYWSPATGARTNGGAIRAAYASQGWETGRLGYPTTNEFNLSATVKAQDFQGGRITWSATAGTSISYR